MKKKNNKNKSVPEVSKEPVKGPIALILAGYDKVDSETKEEKKEIAEAYDPDELYFGQNKFLHSLAGKPAIQYVIDAVYNAEKNGKKIYDKIYVYNDVESFTRQIDVTKYPNLVVKEMTESVAGNWKDFYFTHLDYGHRIDVFFGDTPRIEPEDVLYIHDEYSKILGKKKDHRGVPVNMIFAIVEYDDVTKDNWLEHRIKFIKRGANKGKLKSFVSFENFQARVGNSGALLKTKGLDELLDSKSADLVYNLRKALTPRIFSKILYHIWKSKHIHLVRQVKNKCINIENALDTLVDVLSKVHKIDLDGWGMGLFSIRKNAARWENDIDGPKDYKIFQKKYGDTPGV